MDNEDTQVKVLNILDNIKSNQSAQDTIKESKVKKKSKKNNADSVRGVPKSGRFWKSKKERFNSIVKTKGIRLDFEKKTALRLELKRTKELSRQIIDQVKEKEEARKERRRQNLKRAEENKKKSEIVQVITNTKKLKRMKKKQMRFIEKRDTNKAIANQS